MVTKQFDGRGRRGGPEARGLPGAGDLLGRRQQVGAAHHRGPRRAHPALQRGARRGRGHQPQDAHPEPAHAGAQRPGRPGRCTPPCRPGSSTPSPSRARPFAPRSIPSATGPTSTSATSRPPAGASTPDGIPLTVRRVDQENCQGGMSLRHSHGFVRFILPFRRICLTGRRWGHPGPPAGDRRHRRRLHRGHRQHARRLRGQRPVRRDRRAGPPGPWRTWSATRRAAWSSART